MQDVAASINELKKGISPGKMGFDNELLLWIYQYDSGYNFVQIMYEYCKELVLNGLPEQIARCMTYIQGTPLGKEKDGVPDHDIRPISNYPSLAKLGDKIIVKNIPKKIRETLMGESQLVGKKDGCEKGSVTAEVMRQMILHDSDLGLLSLDATNAFGSTDRQKMYELICDEMPDMIQYYKFLAAKSSIVDFGYAFSVCLSQGGAQGLWSTVLCFCAAKRKIQQDAQAATLQQHPDFQILAKQDWVDDGLELVQERFMFNYLENLRYYYGQWEIAINKIKTRLIFKIIQKQTQLLLTHKYNGYKVVFDGNFIYLGVPHGDDQYVMQFMNKQFMKLQKKILHIELISHRQIRTHLYLRFMNYNKVIYYLKNVRYIKQWMEQIQFIYNYIRKSITECIKNNEKIQHQLSITLRAGGWGLRSPIQFFAASKISALRSKVETVLSLFHYTNIFTDQEIENENKNNEDIDMQMNDEIQIRLQSSGAKWNILLENALDVQTRLLEKYIDEFNAIIGPDEKYDPIQHSQHRDLLKLIDNMLINKFKSFATDRDKCRLNAASVNGANAWIMAIANDYLGCEYSNQQFWILQCLHLGVAITPKKTICARCNKEMDGFGYHALHCSFGKWVILRHNDLRDLIAAFFRAAGFVVQIEQRFAMAEFLEQQSKLGNVAVDINDFRNNIAGDIKVLNYDDGKDCYFDVTVVNPMAMSYVKGGVKKRLFAAGRREQDKIDKYDFNQDQFKPLVIEALGGIGGIFKDVLRDCVNRISVRKNIPYSISMSNLRKRWVS